MSQLLRNTILGTLLLAGTGFGTTAELSPTAKRVSQLNCYDALASEIGTWTDSVKWKRYGNNSAGYRVYRSPTQTIGTWVEIVADKTSVKKLNLLKPDAVTQLEIAPDCGFSGNTYDRQLDDDLMSLGVTDELLASKLSGNKNGTIVMAWSPHMPWSLEMFDYVSSVAKKKSLEVVVALDPQADPDFAKELAKTKGLEDAYIFRPVESLELIFRGMTTHYPSVLLFNNGGFSKLLPGREIEPALVKFAEVQTERLNAEMPSYTTKKTQHKWLYMTLLGLMILAALATLAHKKFKGNA